jgi:hypothetical protein
LVSQATGVAAVQLDCDVTEVFDRLRAHAQAAGESLEQVALDVIHRVIRLDH